MKASTCHAFLLLLVICTLGEPVQAADSGRKVLEYTSQIHDVAALKARAEKGDPSAQTTLAECLFAGSQGLATNRVEAFKWAVVAASQGHKDSQHVLAEFSLFMTAPERSKGKREAEAYLDQRKKAGPRAPK